MKENNAKTLNEEESEQVNGGNLFQTSNDSDFLKHIGIMNESVDTSDLTFHWESCSAKVDDGWSKLGITCVTNPADFNEYYYMGKKISRIEAYMIAMDKTGVQVDYDDYVF